MRRRLLTSTFGVAVAAVLAFGAGLVISTEPNQWRLSPLRLALLSGGVLLVAIGLSLAPTRRLSRPVQDLAPAADPSRSGEGRRVGRGYGIADLGRIADGWDSAVQRVTDFISADRDFAVDASHQLRTPLTALSMGLEEMIEAAEDPAIVREEGAAALAQTDRLTQVVSQLLGRARRSPSGAPTLANINDIVAQQGPEWEPAFSSTGRKIGVV